VSFNIEPPPSTIKEFAFQWKTWLNNFYTWVRLNMGTDFYTEVAKGNVDGHSVIHKFGSSLLTSTQRVITQTGTYETPLAPVTLEVLSDDINDTAAGTGAQQVMIIGLDLNYEEISFTAEMNGITPVTLSTDLIRLYRWYVNRTGSYADSTTSSHVGALSIQASGGGAVWDIMPNTPLPYGQSSIGAYTIPKGKTGYLLSKQIFVDSTKSADIFFFKREHADDVTAPFSGTRRLLENEIGVAGTLTMNFRSPKGPFVGPCDVGFFGSVEVSTAFTSVEFELLLVDD